MNIITEFHQRSWKLLEYEPIFGVIMLVTFQSLSVSLCGYLSHTSRMLLQA